MDKHKAVVEALTDYKSSRDAMIHSDSDELIHHLKEFVRELDRNQLCRDVLLAIPPFDADAWWEAEVKKFQEKRRLEFLNLPEDKNERFCALLNLTKSFGSAERNQLTAEQFGTMLGKYKRDDCYSLAKSLVLRPFAEELTRRLRETAAMANPDVRELAGVPLARIPNQNETSIFLSHKWANKERVRRYHSALKQIGLDPWIDDAEVTAGDVLHRALTSGMDRSCAAVFFVTAQFEDDRWLGREVDFAMNRKVACGPKFQIITLVFDNAQVPRSLREYVYLHVDNDIDGLREIIRAIPIELGPPRWKEHIVAER